MFVPAKMDWVVYGCPDPNNRRIRKKQPASPKQRRDHRSETPYRLHLARMELEKSRSNGAAEAECGRVCDEVGW